MCSCVLWGEAVRGNEAARRCVDRPCFCHERGCPKRNAYVAWRGGD